MCLGPVGPLSEGPPLIPAQPILWAPSLCVVPDACPFPCVLTCFQFRYAVFVHLHCFLQSSSFAACMSRGEASSKMIMMRVSLGHMGSSAFPDLWEVCPNRR